MRKSNVLKPCCILVAIFLIAFPCFAADTLGNDKNALYLKYSEIGSNLADSPFGVPIHIETSFSENKFRCYVYGIIDQEFHNLSLLLRDSMNLCEILLLHTNIKSCTVSITEKGSIFMTIYCGKKKYQQPEDTSNITLKYEVPVDELDYFLVRLSGKKGPFMTRNHLIRIDAVPLQRQKTFIRLSYEYDTGLTMESALGVYYATLGRKKVGFTIIGKDKGGNPVYVKGNQGLIERNSVRFYFAVQAFMETFEVEKDIRFNKRIHYWYSLVSQCPRQLYELPEKEYIENKIKENKNQKRLQQGLLKKPLP